MSKHFNVRAVRTEPLAGQDKLILHVVACSQVIDSKDRFWNCCYNEKIPHINL